MMESFILSAGIFFLEDSINFLLQFPARFKKENVTRCGKDRSLVRKIGSKLVWIRAKRLHVVWREVLIDNNSESEDMFKSTCRCGESKCSDNKLESKIEDLEKELSNLQEQVAELLFHRENKLIRIDEGSSQSESVVTTSTNIISIPPPPPPLPPPPPPFVQNKTITVKVQPKSINSINKYNYTSSLIEELSIRPPKLRHVQRSPGGRAVKKQPRTDSADILTNALKKRFDAMHSPKCEAYKISPHRPEFSNV